MREIPFRGLIWPVLLFIAFGTVAAAMQAGSLASLDETLMLSLRTGDRHEPIGPLAMERAAVFITHLGDYLTIAAITIAAILFLLLSGRRATALLVFASVAGGALLNEILKTAFDRARPDLVAHIVDVHSLSFPSGHAMSAATLYLTLGTLIAQTRSKTSVRMTVIATAIAIAFAVGVSRVYLGVHWPSDVVAGWLAGGAWALLCLEIARRLQKRGAIEKPD